MRPEAQGRSITVKTANEIQIMYQANQIVARVLEALTQAVAPGMTTLALDQLAETCCRDHGAIPAFKGYKGFSGSLCASINEEVVHGIPSSKRYLRDGDIISFDFGTLFHGFYGDSALTLSVGEVAEPVRRLLKNTQESLYKGIEQAQIGKRISDISAAVQQHVEQEGFSVVRQFVGHGIGTQLHEAPEIPNYVQKNLPSPRLVEGMVLAIEPMVNLGTAKVKILKDQWTVVTVDKKPSAHFEHSVAVTKDGPLILSTRKEH